MKISALIIILMSFATVARADMKLGLEVGMTFSNVSGPSDVTPSNRTGLAAGLSFEFPIAPIFAMQLEALFVQRGVDLARAGSSTLTASYNSLEFPLLAKLKLPGDVSPFLVAGPVAYFNLSKSLTLSTPPGTTAITFSPKTFDFGVALGGGVDFGPIFATLRYTFGITNLDENSSDFKSRGVHLLAGLRF